MSKLLDAGAFEVKIGGVVFKLRRRSTALMLKVGDVRRVFGLLASSKGEDPESASALAEANEAYLKLQSGVIRHALLEIDGEPYDGTTVSDEELEPFADGLFKAFMASGLDPDFTPGS